MIGVAKLKENTVVTGRDGSAVSLLAGQDVPRWAAKQVGDHLVDKKAGTDSGSSSGDNAEPPRGGEGATEEAWREYATGLGIEVPEDAGRDDIVALVDAHQQ